MEVIRTEWRHMLEWNLSNACLAPCSAPVTQQAANLYMFNEWISAASLAKAPERNDPHLTLECTPIFYVFSSQWSNAEIHHLHSCSHCWDKISQRATGKESLFWLPFCRHSPSRQRRHGRRSLRQLVTSCPQAGSRERWMRMISSFSSLFSTGSKLTRQCSWI